MTSWRTLLFDEMIKHGELIVDIIHPVLSDKFLDHEFDDDLGIITSKPLLIWSDKRVYFSCEYDGGEYVGSVPRNPSEEKPKYL